MPFNTLLIALKTTAFRPRRRFARPVIVDGVRLIVGRIGVDIHPVHAVTLEVVVRAGRAVNRNFVEVRPAETADLRIGIGEEAPLQQGIVGEIEPWDNMARMEGHLFVFGKEVIRVTIEHHFANPLHRHQRFWDQFRRVEQVEIKLELILFRDQL